MSEAFPRRPAPRRTPPTAEEIAAAREQFALHIPSLFTRECLAADCGRWPCRPYRHAIAVLEAAAQFDVNGRLRDS
ncbi:MAG: hypothetical protein ACRDUA_02725 [Micromonosporaceae bacterium]